MLKPIKIMDIELSRPLTTIENLGNYDSLQVLVRLHDIPIGYIKVPLVNGCCTATTISKAILEKHSKAILQHLLCDGLVTRHPSNGFSITDLLAIQHPIYSGPLPLVTVAVCTRDRTDDLALCLDSLDKLDYPALDVLVVDNAPLSDSTECLVCKKYPHMRYVREPRPGLDWARNRAIVEARGEIIAFTDDDVVVDPGWIKALAVIFSENPEVMAVTGLIVPYELETEAQIFFEMRGGFGKRFKRAWYRMNQGNGKPTAALYGFSDMFGAGANMAFRRRLFEHIGHFAPALDMGTATKGGGDMEMFFRVLKKGYTLVYEPGAVVRHCHRRNYAQLRKQMASWGTSFYAYVTLNAIAYPDERIAFVRLGLWFLRFQIQRLLNSLVHPPGYPRDLLLTQLFSSFSGPICYLKAWSTAAKIARDFGPVPQVMAADVTASQRTIFNRQSTVAERIVDLNQPLPVLADVSDYPAVRVFVTKNGCTLGSVDITNSYTSVSVARLSDVIVDTLSPKLLKSYFGLSMDSLHANMLAALSRHDTSTEVLVTETVPLNLLTDAFGAESTV